MLQGGNEKANEEEEDTSPVYLAFLKVRHL